MKRTIVLFLILLLSLSASAFATTILKMDLKTLTEKSQLIVQGSVIKVESKYAKESKIIETFVTVKPDKVLKGIAADSVTIKVPGGKVGEQSMLVMGAPVFQEGEQVFLLLERTKLDDTMYWVSGFFQGRYLIFQSQGADYAVMDQGKGSKIFAECQEEIPACLKSRGINVMPLDRLLGQVRTLLKNPEQNTP